MSVHQILTGALNRGEGVFSVGSIDGLNFTVCAVGTNVVIISSSFERIQVLTPASNAVGQLVTCVNCCRKTGKIAATYGNVVRMFGAVPRTDDGNNTGYPYQWVETHTLVLENCADKVLWNLQGLRLLICCDNTLHLYQHSALSAALIAKTSEPSVTFGIPDEENETEDEIYKWECIWTKNLIDKPKYVCFSPDGAYFATCGATDCLVKIWYQKEAAKIVTNAVDFSFLYLQHPQIVTGFEWRQISLFMARQCVQNVILTWCADHTVRFWREAPNSVSEFQVIGNIVDGTANEKSTSHWKSSSTVHLRGTQAKIKAFLKRISNQKVGSNGDIYTAASFSSDTSLCEIASGEHRESMPGFYLCSTINAQNDCLLVPELSANSGKNPFSIHWLNNKEVTYNVGVEMLMVDVLTGDRTSLSTRNEVPEKTMEHVKLLVTEANGDIMTQSTDEQSEAETPFSDTSASNGSKESRRAVSLTSSTDTTRSRDSMDLKLDMLLRDWKKSNDVLFAVHPVDGSLLTWSVEWLDDGFRQPAISFTSRIPNAFSLSDSTSLNPSLFAYYPNDISHSNLLQQQCSTSEISRKLEQRILNVLYLLTHHNNGSLNMWHLTMEDNLKYNNILNISHASRMCGHRYKISHIIAHPVLPLVLTTSHYDYVRQEDGENGRAELILWKIKPVGPLCKCGGVRELARITNNSSDSFTAVTWLPAILPNPGSFSTSPSSCFIANVSDQLSVYQAVVDAASFLAEMHASEEHGRTKLSDSSSDAEEDTTKKCSLKDSYKVVSTQSSAKPGCILLLSKIPDTVLNVEGMLLLHVFDERLVAFQNDNVISNTEEKSDGQSTVVNIANKYFLVAFENEKMNAPRLRMWCINIAIDSKMSESGQDSASALRLLTELVYDDHLTVSDNVSIISAEPAAGHLSSSNLFPTCHAPYHILMSCSDDHVCFLECTRSLRANGTTSYNWRKWGMVSNSGDSDIEMDGQIFAISSAHSNRFASAYLPEGMYGVSSTRSTIKVAVYECESSGGVEWLREDTIIVDGKRRGRSPYTNAVTPDAVDKKHSAGPIGEGGVNVRLKWVSAEDGSHILTVAVGTSVYLYIQVSQGAAQRNIVMMKEHDTHRRAPLRKASSLAHPETISSRLVRWLCIRYLELKSADGQPPYPTTLGWVRNGLLIVGMHSEMRCYNQWNFVSESSQESKIRDSSKHQAAIGGLVMSASHAVIEQLAKKQKPDPTAPKQKLYKDLLHKVHSTPHDLHNLFSKDENVLDAISDEGLFEATRLASPILPQYHPKLLIELLNSGKTREVKAILLHVLRSLRQLNVSMPNPLSRASSLRKMSVADSDTREDVSATTVDVSRGLSDTFDDNNPEYDELDAIAPLPLYALLCADNNSAKKPLSLMQNGYNPLFDKMDEASLDETFDLENDMVRSRHNSMSVDDSLDYASTNFTARHNRLLTEYLTHTHLPGLSSVDQMHLLAIADTLSHFSSNVMDKLTQANAVFRNAEPRAMSDAATGYATSAVGFETVDECGLRYLMAMKQHEYLLLCLPLKQKQALRANGLPSSQVIWALHSETETELLNATACLQKSTVTWDEVRAIGIAWWLKNTASLRAVIEKLAKAAFQKNQDPMDASLFYLMMKKKNVLTHLFKTVRDQKMVEFFMHDFTEDRWKKAAMKNAFVLMGRQRFHHAAAFFLLAGSLKDAIQTVLSKLKDLQLAMTIIRVYAANPEEQSSLMKELLYREIFGVNFSEIDDTDSLQDILKPSANRNPFVRSMSYWHLKEYTRAASTLVEEASKIHPGSNTEYSLSDIYNFYSFIRTHPLVIRQKLADAGMQMGSTEQFLAVAKTLATVITPADRRLYFRTASAHMASGCPLLALDVLMRLPKNLRICVAAPSSLSVLVNGRTKENENDIKEMEVVEEEMEGIEKVEEVEEVEEAEKVKNVEPVDDIDWSAPTASAPMEELDLKMSDSDESESSVSIESVAMVRRSRRKSDDIIAMQTTENSTKLDVIAQHMKFVATLRLLVEELSTLSNGFEVDGGQLRAQLLNWVENGVSVLEQVCDYRSDHGDLQTTIEFSDDDVDDATSVSAECNSDSVPLHKALHRDRKQLSLRLQTAIRRKRWLHANQKLLRAYASYCTLHNSQNHRLTSSLMELLLLLMEVQQDGCSSKNFTGSLPVVHSFPLFIASVSPYRMFVSSPLSFIQNLCSDILSSINDIHEPPRIEYSLTKVYKLYSLCQGLSSCLYQSLCDADSCASFSNLQQTGALTRLLHSSVPAEELIVCTPPAKWPGVDNLVALLNHKKEDKAPQLRLLLVEIFVAVFVSLFQYAFTVYDARWLYRLSAREIDAKEFSIIFGGGGESKQKVAPPRPPPPLPKSTAPGADAQAEMSDKTRSDSVGKKNLSIDSSTFRAKFNTKLFGSQIVAGSTDGSQSGSTRTSEQTFRHWVAPKKSMVQLFAERPTISVKELGMDYDSDEEHDDYEDEVEEGGTQTEPYNDPENYAWRLMRLVLIHQQLYRMKVFVSLAGIEFNDLGALSPRADAVFKLLEKWIKQLEEQLDPDACPPNFLSDMTIKVDPSANVSPLNKYACLLVANNTPFESSNPAAKPIKRVWLYLVRQKHLLPIFVKYVFGSKRRQQDEMTKSADAETIDSIRSNTSNTFKIVQRENEQIAAFCCSKVRPGWLAISTTRELQEMDIGIILDKPEGMKLSTWMFHRAELDIALDDVKTDVLKDNDDYQLLIERQQKSTSGNFITPFIIDRSRKALKKLLKRQVNNIRRMDSHPVLPYYVSGSSDGSIRLWEWGIGQPLHTPRVAGQYAKVTKVLFSCNGNKFASIDNDGILCLWRATQGMPLKKPFYNQKCHSKSAADVLFLGTSSTVLVTAGSGLGDENIAIWDTLMPQSKAMVHSWVAHPEGATSLMYLHNQQCLVSGGRHGDLCLWDIRQRKMRCTVKCFENSPVKCLAGDPYHLFIVAGSNDGDVKIWGADSFPHMLCSLDGEHAAKGGFSLRQVASTIQGVQQMYIDADLRLYSCGADCSLKIRSLNDFT